MKIVVVTSCAGGIAHSYMAAEALEMAAKAAGDEIHIEIQGSLGIENELSQKQIDEADLVLFSADIKVSRSERFEKKNIINSNPHDAIANGKAVLEKAKREAGLL